MMSSIKQKHAKNYRGDPRGSSPEKYREDTWKERMDSLPRNSAYKSSISFTGNAMTTIPGPTRPSKENSYYEEPDYGPFRRAQPELSMKDLNPDDPK